MSFSENWWPGKVGNLCNLLAVVSISSYASASFADCDRDAFGPWTQEDYTNTRATILERKAIGEMDWLQKIDHETGKKGPHLVLVGTWRDGSTGKVLNNYDAAKVHIDHVVPVCFAWERGAKEWTDATRRRFYNDIELLIVTEGKNNLEKGKLPPWRYLPPEKVAACNYARTFTHGIEKYRLFLSPEERKSLNSITQTACLGEN